MGQRHLEFLVVRLYCGVTLMCRPVRGHHGRHVAPMAISLAGPLRLRSGLCSQTSGERHQDRSWLDRTIARSHISGQPWISCGSQSVVGARWWCTPHSTPSTTS